MFIILFYLANISRNWMIYHSIYILTLLLNKGAPLDILKTSNSIKLIFIKILYK